MTLKNRLGRLSLFDTSVWLVKKQRMLTLDHALLSTAFNNKILTVRNPGVNENNVSNILQINYKTNRCASLQSS